MLEVGVPEEYWALRKEVGAVWVGRDFVKVSGPDAFDFLQGQLSQNLSGMEEGDARLSFLLSPRGKVDAFLRVSLDANGYFIIDTDAGYGQAVKQRLDEFKFRVKCDIEIVPWQCLALRGQRCADYYSANKVEVDRSCRLAVTTGWPEWPGLDLLGDNITPPGGVRLCSGGTYEALRIETGIPQMGREIDERTIPQETGVVDRTVDFEKGCYTGQELVARIDSRGHVNRSLRGLIFDASYDADVHDRLPGSELWAEAGGKAAGVVTSIGWSQANGVIGLGYVRKEIEPSSVLQAKGDWATDESDNLMARVEALPLLT